jgi:hypothetical protein
MEGSRAVRGGAIFADIEVILPWAEGPIARVECDALLYF